MAFLSTTRTGTLVLHVWSCQLLQQFHRIVPASRTQVVVHPFTLLATDNNARIAEDFHVVGKAGLR